MSRRISIGRGTQDMFSRDLNLKLQAVQRNYRQGLISKKRAKERGRTVIEDEFETLLRVSKNRIFYVLGRVGTLPPEERGRLERWRDQSIADFDGIIDDIKRGLSY